MKKTKMMSLLALTSTVPALGEGVEEVAEKSSLLSFCSNTTLCIVVGLVVVGLGAYMYNRDK